MKPLLTIFVSCTLIVLRVCKEDQQTKRNACNARQVRFKTHPTKKNVSKDEFLKNKSKQTIEKDNISEKPKPTEDIICGNHEIYDS